MSKIDYYDDSDEIPELTTKYFIINKDKKFLKGYYTFIDDCYYATMFDKKKEAEQYIKDNKIKNCYITEKLLVVEDIKSDYDTHITCHEMLCEFIDKHINELLYEPWSKLDEICSKYINNYVSYEFFDNNNAVLRFNINNEIVEYSVTFEHA